MKVESESEVRLLRTDSEKSESFPDYVGLPVPTASNKLQIWIRQPIKQVLIIKVFSWDSHNIIIERPQISSYP